MPYTECFQIPERVSNSDPVPERFTAQYLDIIIESAKRDLGLKNLPTQSQT